jgi:hypothetical protein
VVEGLPGIHEALSSIPSTAKNLKIKLNRDNFFLLFNLSNIDNFSPIIAFATTFNTSLKISGESDMSFFLVLER